MDTASVAYVMGQIGAHYSLAPFGAVLQPLIEETLVELKKTTGVGARC